MMTPEEMRQEPARKQKALRGLVEALGPEKEPSALEGRRTPAPRDGCRYDLVAGSPPTKPRPGAHAGVQLTGTRGRTGSGVPLRKKNQAIVLITWPGGSAARTVKGNLTIRYVMERCAAFNQISGT
jgi:hypothetical protein